MIRSTSDDVRAYVLTVLAGHADGFDVEGIVADILASDRSPVPWQPVTALDTWEGFWNVVKRHEHDGGGGDAA